MKRFTAVILLVFGIAMLLAGIYLALEPSTNKSPSNTLETLGAIILGVLAAGTGIRDWLELFKGSEEQQQQTKIEASGNSQVSLAENSRNIQTGGGDYIEKLEISLSVQDGSFEQQAVSKKTFSRIDENVKPFLIGIVLDLSKAAFDSVYQLSQKDDDFFQRLIKALNTLVNKAISYCEHPHSKDILPKFSLFFYGFGFGNALKGLDSIARRLGITSNAESEVEIPTEPVRDLLKLTADSEELPCTPNAAELNRYWKTYRTGILAQYVDMEFNDSPLVQSLKIARERFTTEQKDRKYQCLLLVVTNGKFTDGTYSDLIETANAIKNDGITIVVGFVGKHDIMPPQTLFSKEDPKWTNDAKVLFQCSSELDLGGKVGKGVFDMAVEKSWDVPTKAKLFLQVNQQQMLEELIDIITSPLRD
jgi:flagellar basal body-associated protein FliL